MSLKLSDFPRIVGAPLDQKIELIDELWEHIRRDSPTQRVKPAHLEVLEQRVKAVRRDSALALSPSDARAQLKR